MSKPLNMTVVVFALSDQLILVCLEDDGAEHAVADAFARGYAIAGCCAVSGGAANVSIEDGFAATMSTAGAVFAEMLGKRMKQVERVAG